MPKENLVLEYAPPPITTTFPTNVRLIVILFLLSALPLPFVLYVSAASPLAAAVWFFREVIDGWNSQIWLFMMGLFFFVGIPLVLCHLRLLIFGELSKMEIWGGYIVAALGMAPVAAVMSYFAINLLDYTGGWTLEGMLAIGTLVVPAVVTAFGATVV
ncbi:MAG: hypothetical protein FWD61_01840 [Phycisphaerales bacterium]|nr:hypothetical protein [Phycisphaerales bacterium]